MRTIIFNGTINEFDSLYWDIMQGFEQYMTSNNNTKSVCDKVTIIKSNRSITCVRWIVK